METEMKQANWRIVLILACEQLIKNMRKRPQAFGCGPTLERQAYYYFQLGMAKDLIKLHTYVLGHEVPDSFLQPIYEVLYKPRWKRVLEALGKSISSFSPSLFR